MIQMVPMLVTRCHHPQCLFGRSIAVGVPYPVRCSRRAGTRRLSRLPGSVFSGTSFGVTLKMILWITWTWDGLEIILDDLGMIVIIVDELF